eukprot:2449451-Prymnesium_polylepis.2
MPLRLYSSYTWGGDGMKTKPITIPAHRYANRTTDHLSVVPSTTRPVALRTTQFSAVALAVRDQANQTNPGTL